MVLVAWWGESLWMGSRKDGRREARYSAGNPSEELSGKGRREVGWEVKGEVRSRNIFKWEK